MSLSGPGTGMNMLAGSTSDADTWKTNKLCHVNYRFINNNHLMRNAKHLELTLYTSKLQISQALFHMFVFGEK